MNFLALLFVGLLGTGYAIQIDSRKSTDNAHAELAIIASLPASDSGRISTDHSYHPSTLVTHVKAYPPQQTHLGPGDHVINIPKGVKVFAGPLDFSSPRSTDSPADAIGAIRHTDLRRRTMEENAIVDNASPVISNEDSTIQQETENTPDIHAFANTGNPRIPFVMPRPPLAHRSNEPSPNRPYSRSIMVSARQNPPVKNITIWPSLLVPVSKLHPDIEFGDWPRNLTWMVEGANEGGLEVAYDVPVNNASHCSIEFFLSGIPGPMNVEGANWTSSIYAYRYGAGSVSENDTWNERPQVDYGVLVANITGNSTGTFVEGGKFICNRNGGQAAFFVNVTHDSNPKIKWLLKHNVLVLRMYGEGHWLRDYGDARHIIYPPAYTERVIGDSARKAN